MPEKVDLGPCCACEESGPTVRTVLMLPWRGTEAEGGWGCAQCGLEPCGAVAVFCDRCVAEERDPETVCAGYPTAGRRVPIAQVRGAANWHEHDWRKHPEVHALTSELTCERCDYTWQATYPILGPGAVTAGCPECGASVETGIVLFPDPGDEAVGLEGWDL